MNKRAPAKDSFNRQVLTLMAGTTVAQAIPVGLSPILTRIYTPEDFGLLALFISITTILGTVANARYELAIVLPERDEDALNIAALGLVITTALSLVLMISVSVFNEPISALIGNEQIGPWLYLTPVAVWFTGVFNVFSYSNTRLKNYKDIAASNIYRSVVLVTLQLIVGILKPGVSGLVCGQVAGSAVANANLIKKTWPNSEKRKSVTWTNIKKQAYCYRDFPKFSLWAALSNNMSQYLPQLIVAALYSVSELGFYSLALRVLGLPLSVVGSAVGHVLMQKANSERKALDSNDAIFRSTFRMLVAIGVVPFSVLFFTAEDLFAFIFGSEWREAGIYAKILLPLFFVRFIVGPLTIVNSVNLKNKVTLIWNLILLVLAVSITLVFGILEVPFHVMLSVLSPVLAAFYICYLFTTYGYTKRN